MSTCFQIADFTIHRLIEDEHTNYSALGMLPGLTQELLDENSYWLQPDFMDGQGRVTMCFQSYVVVTQHHRILIDSCVGNDKNRPNNPDWHMKSGGRYMEALADAGLQVEDIDYVMCTHLHGDHVGWNTRLIDGRWVPTFPNAKYVFAAQEHDYWAGIHRQSGLPSYEDSVLPIVQAGRAELVSNDHQIGDHIRMMPTKGHTPGHVAICLGRGRDDGVFPGDLIHTPLQTRYPELSVRFDSDQALAAQTRRDFLERYADTPTQWLTTHFPSPSVGLIKRWDDGFRFIPNAL